MTAADLAKLLAAKYAAPEYAVFYELRNGTGYVKSERYADVVAMSVWPSRGLELLGFETKVHRGDWLRELRNPAKTEGGLLPYCDRWYLVTADDKVVQAGELPPTWGWMHAATRGDKLVLKVAREAPRLSARPLDRGLVASILRRVHESHVVKSSIDARLEEKYQAGVKAGIGDRESDRDALKTLRAEVAAFERASGVDIRGWRGAEPIGRAVKWTLEHGPERVRRDLEHHRDWLRTVARQVDEALANPDA